VKRQQDLTRMEYEAVMKTKQVVETVNQSMRRLEEMETVKNQIKDYERRKRSIEMHK
jgi:protein-tyrosine phosphatase